MLCVVMFKLSRLNEVVGPGMVFMLFGSQSSSASAEYSRNNNSTSAAAILLDAMTWLNIIIVGNIALQKLLNR